MITVLLFARLKDEIGTGRLTLEMGSTTVSALLDELKTQYPAVHFEPLMVAVNEEMVPPDTTIHPGDTVALLPPVSGG